MCVQARIIFWARMRQLRDEGIWLPVQVKSATNSGGLLVESTHGSYQGIGRGFLPKSHFGSVSDLLRHSRAVFGSSKDAE